MTQEQQRPESITLRLPRTASWYKHVHEVPSHASSGYDYHGPPNNPKGFITPGQLVRLELGTVLVSKMEQRRRLDRVAVLYRVHVLLPDGTLYNTERSVEGRHWATMLRDHVRGWLQLTPEARVVRAINEHIAQIAGGEVVDLPPGDPSTHSRIQSLEHMAALAAEGCVLSRTFVRRAFHEWLQSVANSAGVSTDEVLDMLDWYQYQYEANARRSAAPTGKRGRRRIRFLDNPDEDKR